MPDLKTLGSVIGWVGGSMAGITALLYAIGFVATLYHFNQMGMDSELVSRDGFVYVGRGAIALNNAFLFIFLGAVLAGAIVWIVDRLLALLARLVRAIRRNTAASDDFASAAVLLLVAVGLVVFALSAYVGNATAGPGLLFTGDVCPDGGIRRICDPRLAEQTFGRVSVVAGATLIVSWVGASRVTGEGMVRKAALAGYAITALIVVFFMIPVAYGTMLIREEMPQVLLTPEDVTRFHLDGSGVIQLLRQDSSGTLLWIRASHQVRWIAPGELKSLGLVRVQASTAAPMPPTITPPAAKPGGPP